MNNICCVLMIALLSFFSSSVRGQFKWVVTHTDEDQNFQYAFTSVSCHQNTCTAGALKIDKQSGQIYIVLFRSTDDGKTWVEQNPNLPYQLGQNQNYFRVIQQIDSLNCVAIGDTGLVIRTFDGGNTWNTQDCHTQHLLTDVHFNTADEGMIVNAGPEPIRITSDGGLHWNEVTFTHINLNQCYSYGQGRFSTFQYGHGPFFFYN